ncbi:MAG: tryptophan synthase subunit alpha [Planctomycetota bacterium]
MVDAGHLAAHLRAIRDSGRAAFIPYITAGDPSLAQTAVYLRQLAAAGADLIELGVPFSDPIADGVVNQQAAERALAAGTTLGGILDMVAALRADGFATPCIVFTYLNPLLRMGVDAFAERAAAAGVQGALVVDLPPEEADEFVPALHARGLDTVFLASPTTPPERLARVAAASSGFVYYVSRLGVTGERQALSDSLADEVSRVRAAVAPLPVAVGFGISTPEQAAAVAAHADGVVVGSALVKFLADAARDPAGAGERMAALARSIAGALGG